MKCVGCGKELSKEQEKHNERIAEKSGTKRLDVCDNCWADYLAFPYKREDFLKGEDVFE